MTEDEMKSWIDAASYGDLLSRWQHAVAGDPFFVGAVGAYYCTVLTERRQAVGEAAHSRASKAISYDVVEEKTYAIVEREE